MLKKFLFAIWVTFIYFLLAVDIENIEIFIIVKLIAILLASVTAIAIQLINTYRVETKREIYL